MHTWNSSAVTCLLNRKALASKEGGSIPKDPYTKTKRRHISNLVSVTKEEKGKLDVCVSLLAHVAAHTNIVNIGDTCNG